MEVRQEDIDRYIRSFNALYNSSRFTSEFIESIAESMAHQVALNRLNDELLRGYILHVRSLKAQIVMHKELNENSKEQILVLKSLVRQYRDLALMFGVEVPPLDP